MIIDNHVHLFTDLGGNSEYKTEGIQLMYAQKMMSTHFLPLRRVDDYSIINEQNLWDEDKPGPEGRRNVNFRAGGFGRYVWTVDGVDYSKQYMPVGMQKMVASPEFLIEQMNYVGVDKAVLQHGHTYGKLKNYYHKAVKKFPDRFIGLTQIDEPRAYYEDQIGELHRAIDKLGLRGLFFDQGTNWVNNFKQNFDEEIYNPFWEEVDSLSIPVYAEVTGSKFLYELKGWESILEKHPDITLVITVGIPVKLILKDGKPYIPEIVHRLVTTYKVFLEVTYPITIIGKDSEYPYPEAQQIIKHLFDTFGPKKLIWGTDMPNVERFCTYGQALNFLKNHCNFLSNSDKELILGKNVAKIFGLDC